MFLQSNLNAQYAWQALPNAPKSWRCDDMYFLNPMKGWVINPYYHNAFPMQYGRIFTTDDGGQTWQKLVDSSITFIRSIGFTDSLNGWFGNLGDSSVTSDTNFMYHSIDGGNTWSPVLNFTGPRPKGICGISIVNDTVIYAYGRYFGPAVLMKTMDGGQTWNSQSLDSIATGLVDGYFFDKDTGFVTGCYGSPPMAQILSTFDGGATWQVRHQSLRAQEIVWKISFPTRDTGYASIESGLDNITNPDTTYYLKTIDGGITWQEYIFKTNGFYDMQGIGFINDTVGWIGGDSVDSTYKTTDGGNTWAVDNTFGVLTPPYNLEFVINRFRRFGDTLMYASGNTVYKMQKGYSGIPLINSPIDLINVYPNPSDGKYTVELNGKGNGAAVEVYNLVGELIYRSVIKNDKSEIDLSNNASGVYFTCIKTSDTIYYSKIIKE